MLQNEITSKIVLRDNWPTLGITYVDTADIFADGSCFRDVVAALVAPYEASKIDVIIGLETRGLVLAAALAHQLGVGLVMIRKKGKLMPPVIVQEYSYEYSTSVIEMKTDAIKPGQRVVLVDDVLATGATLAAAVKLAKRLGGDIIGISVIVEKKFLAPQTRLSGYPVHSLVQY
ncbi:MAG: adenine phosphoribosyltransferase [Patescibacteria group bacterium]